MKASELKRGQFFGLLTIESDTVHWLLETNIAGSTRQRLEHVLVCERFGSHALAVAGGMMGRQGNR